MAIARSFSQKAKDAVSSAGRAIGNAVTQQAHKAVIYVKHRWSNFNGTPSVSTPLGLTHSIIASNLLIRDPNPEEIKLQYAYRVEGDTMLERSKEIHRLIIKSGLIDQNTPLTKERLEEFVQCVCTSEFHEDKSNSEYRHRVCMTPYYDDKLFSNTPHYLALVKDHADEIRKILKPTKAEKKAHEEKIEKLKNKLEELKTDKNSSKRVIDNAESLIALKMNPEKEAAEQTVVHAGKEKDKLTDDRKSVMEALKKHVTELYVWQWIEMCLLIQNAPEAPEAPKDPSDVNYVLDLENYNRDLISYTRDLTNYNHALKIKEYFEIYKNDPREPEHLKKLSRYILDYNPCTELFKVLHIDEAVSIKSFIKQKIQCQQTNKELIWRYICPTTEYHLEFVQGKARRTKPTGQTSQPGTPRDHSPIHHSRAPSRQRSGLLHSPIEKKELRPTTPLSRAQVSQPQKSTHSPSQPSPQRNSKQLFVIMNRSSEAKYDKSYLLPVFSNVATRNPLRWVAAGFNGASEYVLVSLSGNPASKYLLGSWTGFALSVIAVPVNLSANLTSFTCKTLCKTLPIWIYESCCKKPKIIPIDAQDIENPAHSGDFSPRSPASKLAQRDHERSVSRRSIPSRSRTSPMPKPVVKAAVAAAIVDASQPLPALPVLSIDIHDDHTSSATITPVAAFPVQSSSAHVTQQLLTVPPRHQKEIKASHGGEQFMQKPVRRQGTHTSMDFRLLALDHERKQSKSSMEFQNIVKELKLDTIQDDEPAISPPRSAAEDQQPDALPGVVPPSYLDSLVHPTVDPSTSTAPPPIYARKPSL